MQRLPPWTDEFIILGFTGLVHLSHLIDAIIDEGDLDTSSPPDNVPELFKRIGTASNKARADDRTWRVASMTELMEPVTGAMSVQKCLTHSIRRKHIMDAGDTCRLEALVLRTFSPRFLHSSRTGEFANSLIMPEATRSLIESEALALSNASAQKLAPKKSCVDFVVRAVGKRWRMIEFPTELKSLPVGQEDCLEFWETLCAFSFGSDSQRKTAFSTLHLSVLESYTHLSTMLTDNCHRQPSERLEFDYLAVEMYMPGQHPLSLSTMETLDSLVALLELKRLSEGKIISLVPENIKFHMIWTDYIMLLSRMQRARKRFLVPWLTKLKPSILYIFRKQSINSVQYWTQALRLIYTICMKQLSNLVRK